MDIPKILCSISCFILFLTKDVSSFEITVTSSMAPAVLGNHQVSLYCQYTLSTTSELLYAITLNRKRADDGNFNEIVAFEPPGSSDSATYNDGTLASRTVATNPTNVTRLATLEFQEVQCRDKAEYQWIAFYRAGTPVPLNVNKAINMDIKAEPTFSTDGIVTYDMTKSYKAGDDITFTCQGGVGSNPLGDLKWYYYHSPPQSAVVVDVTTSAVEDAPVKITDCTYNKSSTLTLKLSKQLNGFVVRCTVHQDIFTDRGNGYKDLQPIDVQYEPSVFPITTAPSQPSYEMGTSQLTLTCTGDANPNPSFYWVRPDDSQHVGGSLTLTNLALNMTGEYTCVVWNEINGQNYTVNTTVNISVVETTTTSTTTPSSTTAAGPTSEPVTDPDDGMSTSTIVIIVVCVVVGIILIVTAVVVFIKCKGRKRPEIEEPPEKPRNNQDFSFYGNARPDLVSTDMKPPTHALNASFNNSFDSSESKPRNEDLMYVDLAFDDKPRSRRPIHLPDNSSMGSSTPYADIAMPRV